MGYVHDTSMSQYIPPTAMHCVTGTWTDAAGAVSGTIARHKAANAETESSIPELAAFHEIIFPIWHTAYPAKDIAALQSYVPKINELAAQAP